MLLLWVLAVYAVVAGGLMYVLLMGQSPSHRNGIIGKASRCMRALPQQVAYCCCLVANGFRRRKAEEMAAQAEDYCFNKPNRFIQTFYSFLVSTTLYFFWDVVGPQIPTVRDQAVAFYICMTALSCYLMAWLTDAGCVTPAADLAKLTPAQREAELRQNARFAYDGTYFAEDNMCESCNLPKPARSKHCRMLGRCVRRYDHYCPWVCNAVAERTLRWFHAFLISHVVMSAAVAYWSGWVVMNYIDRERLWLARFSSTSGDGRALQASWYIVIMFAMSQNSVASGIALFAAIVALLLAGFWWVNFLHVLRNETTNEKHKREDMSDFLKREAFAAKKRERDAAAQELLAMQAGGVNGGDGGDGDVARTVCSGVAEAAEAASPQVVTLTKEQMERASKFYTAGSYVANIIEAFCPSSNPASRLATPSATAGVSSPSAKSSSVEGGGAANSASKKQQRAKKHQ